MKVLHLSPYSFGGTSVFGGGERYAYELARAVSRRTESVFLSFGPESAVRQEGDLDVLHLKKAGWMDPSAGLRMMKEISGCDVIHCYQIRFSQTDLALLWGKLLGKKVFLTDLGGGTRFCLSDHFPVLKLAKALLLISEYSRRLCLTSSAGKYPARLEVIHGGVDTGRFVPGQNEERTKNVLFVGRLLPHKGVDILIDAVGADQSLRIAGRIYDERYFGLLREKSAGKRVSFLTSLGDPELIQEYQRALVTVLPSVYDNCYGQRTVMPELLGLTVLESMACATPVIVTDVASLPEIVTDGETGFVVPPNRPDAIREKINYLIAHPRDAAEMGKKAREVILERWTWDLVAEKCLHAYQT